MQHKYNKFILQYLPLLAKIEALFIFLTLLDTFLADSDVEGFSTRHFRYICGEIERYLSSNVIIDYPFIHKIQIYEQFNTL